MTLNFADARLLGYEPSNDTTSALGADYELDAADVAGFDIAERAQDLKDSASLTVQNNHGKYSHTVGHGDRLELYISRDGDLPDDPAYYDNPDHYWTGVVRPFSIEGEGAAVYTLDATVEDFAFGVLSMRTVTNAFENRRIVTGDSGGELGILDYILEQNAPEIDRSAFPTGKTAETSIRMSGANLLEAVVELANRLGVILYANHDRLEMVDPVTVTPEFTAQPADYGTWSVDFNDDQLHNDIQVLGGTNYRLDDEVDTVADHAELDGTTRLTRQVPTRKSQIDRVRIHTQRQTGVDNNLVVRLQADDGGQPIAPNDNDSDIARRVLSDEFISEDDWTEFLLPGHAFPPQQNPWLIVESEEEGSGHFVGVDTNGDLAYKTFYPYSVTVRVEEPDSMEDYRRREAFENYEAAETFADARDHGNAYADRYARPDVTLSLDADSERFHDLSPGAVVTFDIPNARADGDFVCVERTSSFYGATVESELTFRDMATLGF